MSIGFFQCFVVMCGQLPLYHTIFFHTPAKSVCVENLKTEAGSFKNENTKFQNAFQGYKTKPEIEKLQEWNYEVSEWGPENRNMKNEITKFRNGYQVFRMKPCRSRSFKNENVKFQRISLNLKIRVYTCRRVIMKMYRNCLKCWWEVAWKG